MIGCDDRYLFIRLRKASVAFLQGMQHAACLTFHAILECGIIHAGGVSHE